MKTLFWLAVLASIVMAVLVIRHIVRKQAARQRAEEARAAELLAVVAANRPAAAPATTPAPSAAPTPSPATELGQQKLLFEAAHKAGEAGEPALALQLYERLIARFPQSAFAEQARAAAQAQQSKLSRTATPAQ